MRTGTGYAITNEQGMGRFGDPLGAFVRAAASARGQGRTRPPSVHRTPGRLVAFSDAVFAVTVTLLVLEIRPPTDYTKLLHGLVELWPSYLAYALTFLFIGQVWANHHVMFDHIRTADRVILLLNTLLLMIVAFLPFVTAVLAGALRSGHGLRIAVISYGIALWLVAATAWAKMPVASVSWSLGMITVCRVDSM
jgi:uncharacterized membrane protein